MLQLVDSDIELQAVDINIRADSGVADVYLNKDIGSYEDEDGVTRYTAKQAYMLYGAFDGMEDTIAADFDTYYDIASDWAPERPMTDTERMAAIEDCLIELSELLYAE